MTISNLTDQVTNIKLQSKLGEVVTTSNAMTSSMFESFIPANTILYIKLDGSGDFTNLPDAIDYLSGKWSNGIVTVQFGEGTFSQSRIPRISLTHSAIPVLRVFGSGIDKTVLNSDVTALAVEQYTGRCIISNLTIRPISTSTNSGIYSERVTKLDLSNLKISRYNVGIFNGWYTNVELNGQIDISNCNLAIEAQNFCRVGHFATTKISNCTTGIRVIRQSWVTCIGSDKRPTFQNVTTQYSPGTNNLTSAGYIYIE